MNRRDRGALIGMILGDGYIRHQGNKYGLAIEHSNKQRDYLEVKAAIIHSMFGGNKPKLYYRERYDKRVNKVYKQVSIFKHHKYFKFLRRLIYPNGIKTYTRRVLNYLTEEGLALWYYDDGNLKKRISSVTGKVGSIQVTLATYCSMEEAQILVDYFKDVWDISFSIHQRKKTKLCVICANSKEGNKFLDIIKRFPIRSMSYKTDSDTSAYPRKGEDIVSSNRNTTVS